MDPSNYKVYVYTELNGLSVAVKDRLPDVNLRCFKENSGSNFPFGLGQFFHISDEDLEEIRQNADVLLSSPPIIVKVLQGENKLKWAQSYSAGVDWIGRDQNARTKRIPITKMGEGWNESMAEYVLGFIMNKERRIQEMIRDQIEREWDRYKYVLNTRLLSSLTVGILGTGRIGTQIAKVLNVFGMTVNGLSQRPKEISSDSPFRSIRQIDEILEFLEESDYIICVLPGTPETKDMLSGEVLKSCKNKISKTFLQKPYLINIGRGDLINASTIEKAIREGWISGALLDVVEPEPLPPDHPLWSIPNVTITPHCSGVPNVIQMADLFARNFDKFKENEPLLYAYDFNSGY